jgi:hypothetical protein
MQATSELYHGIISQHKDHLLATQSYYSIIYMLNSQLQNSVCKELT